MSKVNLIKFIVCILPIVCGIHAVAQNFSDDFKKINLAYVNLNKTIEINNSIVTSSGQSSSNNVTLQFRDVDDYFLKTDDTDVLVAGGIKVSVSHSLKVIMLDSTAYDMNLSALLNQFDTLSKAYSSIRYTTLESGKGRYTLIPRMGKLKSITVDFDKKSYLISHVEIIMFDQMSQQNLSVNNTYTYSSLKSADFPLHSTYFKKVNGRVVLQTKWEKYQLINHIN